MSEREKVQETLLARFQRRGGPTRSTADFRTFPAERQQQILAAAQLATDEIPVLLSFRDDFGWTLVTSQRVIWQNGLGVESLKGSQIEAMISPVTPNDPQRVALSPTGLPLAVRLASNRGQTVDLPVEADKTAYGAMHHVLTFVMESSQMKQAASAKASEAKAGEAKAAAKTPAKTAPAKAGPLQSLMKFWQR